MWAPVLDVTTTVTGRTARPVDAMIAGLRGNPGVPIEAILPARKWYFLQIVHESDRAAGQAGHAHAGLFRGNIVGGSDERVSPRIAAGVVLLASAGEAVL
jgi:hypothetical protein